MNISIWISFLNRLARSLGLSTNHVGFISHKKAVESEYLNADLLLKVYEQCVKPVLLYCSQVCICAR